MRCLCYNDPANTITFPLCCRYSIILYPFPLLQAKPDPLVLDVVGAGEDLAAIQEAARSKGLVWNWLGAKDHADVSMHDYQVRKKAEVLLMTLYHVLLCLWMCCFDGVCVCATLCGTGWGRKTTLTR